MKHTLWLQLLGKKGIQKMHDHKEDVYLDDWARQEKIEYGVIFCSFRS